MTIIFTKMKYEDIPEAIAQRVMRFTDKQVEIDDTGLSRNQLQKLIEFIQQEGYKEV